MGLKRLQTASKCKGDSGLGSALQTSKETVEIGTQVLEFAFLCDGLSPTFPPRLLLA